MAANKNIPGRSPSLQRMIDASKAPGAARQPQPPRTTAPTTLDPVSQSLTDRYLSQQAQPGQPAGRSPNLQAQIDGTVIVRQTSDPNAPTSVDPAGGFFGGHPATGSGS